MERSYDFLAIEKKWREYWDKEKTFKVTEDAGFPEDKRLYVLDMFPYPSGSGLHVGHPEGYTATDIYTRFKKMNGFNVLHPMGFDSFGLPAENYAIQTGKHPAEITYQNIDHFRVQIKTLGFCYDWDREVATSDAEYYKWTQWIFLQLFNKGLAYEAEMPINWCPQCGTGLANEEVKDGKCDRCGTPIERKRIRQWVLKITAYAERLLKDLDLLDWNESIKLMQENWIGKSEGAEVNFRVDGSGDLIRVYTTRPDTLFGATYMVLAPEHPLVEKITAPDGAGDVEKYIDKTVGKSELQRTELNKEKTGVFTGAYAINPVNGNKIPIWIADYVLWGYGTGAIMAVPAHDERDFEFANKFDLPIIRVIHKKDADYLSFIMGADSISEDDLKNSGAEILEKKNGGLYWVKIRKEKLAVFKDLIRNLLKPGFFNEIVGEEIWFLFKTRDGINKEYILNLENEKEINQLAKQFNKGIPSQKTVWTWLAQNSFYFSSIIHPDSGVMENSGQYDKMDSEKFKEIITKWLEDKKIGQKQVNYKLRDWVFSRQRYWGEPIPVVHCEKDGIVPLDEKDLPLILPDVKSYKPTGTGESPLAAITEWVNTKCPKCGGKAKRETNTMPQWAGSCWYYIRFTDPNNDKAPAERKNIDYWLPVDLYIGGAEHAVLHLLYARFWHKFLYDIGVVNSPEPFMKLRNQGMILGENGDKMSKSRGNVVNPDNVVQEYGADTLRIYEMFLGPLAADKPWNTQSIIGIKRFLDKVWRLFEKPLDEKAAVPDELNRLRHKTVKIVTEKIDSLEFNTAVSQMMIFLNALQKEEKLNKDMMRDFIKILHPFAPFVTEEMWEMLGEKPSVLFSKWPVYDEMLIIEEVSEVAIQENGKLRGTIPMPKDTTQEDMINIVKNNEKMQNIFKDKNIVKYIPIQGKVVNVVTVTRSVTFNVDKK